MLNNAVFVVISTWPILNSRYGFRTLARCTKLASKTRPKHFFRYLLPFLIWLHQIFELVVKIFKLNFDLSGPKLLMNGLARLHYDIVFSPDFMKIESGSVYEYNVDECEIGQGYFGKEVCQDDTKYNLSYHIDQGTEANASLEKIMEKCQICFNCKGALKDPVTPKCGHKICKGCLAGKFEHFLRFFTFFRFNGNLCMLSLLRESVFVGLSRWK